VLLLTASTLHFLSPTASETDLSPFLAPVDRPFRIYERMASPPASSNGTDVALQEILSTLKTIQFQQSQLSSTVAALTDRVDHLATPDGGASKIPTTYVTCETPQHNVQTPVPTTPTTTVNPASIVSEKVTSGVGKSGLGTTETTQRKSVSSSRIILTTYPGQSGIDPIRMDWGNVDPLKRGPVVVSRHHNTVRRRNGLLLPNSKGKAGIFTDPRAVLH
jgi:hypothetical protein